jgi:head-tail adaptor
MSAPVLNRLLVLEEPLRVSDGAGGFTLSWSPLGYLWGEVKVGSGREAAGEEINLAQVTYRITVRGAVVGSPQRPKPEQRLRDDTRIFVILAVTEMDFGGHYLTCYAREEVPA